MRKLTCHCEQVFNVDLPEIVNLDTDKAIIKQIADGSFLTCVCPTCETVLHTDLQTRLEWPSKKTTLTLIPEIDRINFLSGMIPTEKDTEILIGFAELADRVAVLEADLSPLAIESLKYHLAIKARKSGTDIKPVIYFEKRTDNNELEFHIHGLKKDEVAITRVPLQVYETIYQDTLKDPENELFTSLRNGAYLSVQNILIEDIEHD